MAGAGKGIRIDSSNLFVICGPETTCGSLLTSLQKARMSLGSYPAASRNTTIGNWISNRGPSVGIFSHGGPEEQVRSLRIVLSNGKAIETGFRAISSFSTGYDLNRLFVGTQDTLGRLSSVTLKLIPGWEQIRPITYSYPEPDQLLEALKKVIKGSTSPYHISFSIMPSGEGKSPSSLLDIVYAGRKEVLDVEEETVANEVGELKGEKIPEVAKERWKTRFFSDKAAKMGQTVIQEVAVPLGKFGDFISKAKGINALLAFSCVVLDRGFVAAGVSLPKDASAQVNIKDLKTKIRNEVVSLGGYYPGLRAWVDCQAHNENPEPVAKTFAAIKTAVDGKKRTPSPEMEEIISQYVMQRDRDTWRTRLSRSSLMKLWPPRRGILHKGLKRRLEAIVGDGNVAFDEFKMYYYTHDLAPLPKLIEIAFKMLPDAVVKPENTKQIVEIMKLASENDIPVVGRGGGSWGFGGAIATQGGIMLDLSSMRRILEFDEDRLLAYCEPSVTWEELATQAERKGFMIGACPSSAPIATIGGWTNTGGAGVGSYKHGTAYSQVAFLKAVMEDGGIIDTEKGFSSNRGNGYDLNALFSGSEGSLGIVTQAAVKLYPKAEEVRPLAYSFQNAMSLQQPLLKISHSNIIPYNISFYDENNFKLLRLLGKEAPEVGSLLSIALRDSTAINEANEKALDRLMELSGGKKEPEEMAKHEWEERSYEMRIRRLGPGGTIGEGVIPTTSFAEMLKRAAKISKEMKMRSTLRGVVVDRNSVAFMPFYLSNERFAIESLASMGFVKRIIDEAVKLGGRPSGLGVWFAWNLNKLHGKDGAQVIRNIKDLIDTSNTVNPGKMTEMRMKFGIPIPGFLMNIGLNVLGMAKKALPRQEITLPSSGG